MNALAALVCSLEVELMPTVRGARVSWQPDPPESRTAIIPDYSRLGPKVG